MTVRESIDKRMWNMRSTYDYSFWNGPDDWFVHGHEHVGIRRNAVVSVQFHPFRNTHATPNSLREPAPV